MLRGYFDDSGTHDASNVVVVAGIIGTESELLSLDGLWRDQLNSPICGLKPPIREFHAFDCFNSVGEFSGWKRTETDYFRKQLRDVIIKSHVSGYGYACFRRDWDELITGYLRNLFGNAEGDAVRNCFVRSMVWAHEHTFDRDISYIFDDSNNLERKRDILAVFDAFKKETRFLNVTGISFMDSFKILPLQAADLFAWEFNRNAQSILEKGWETPTTTELLHLKRGMPWLGGQIARRDAIAKVRELAVSQHDGDVLAHLGDYFKNFGRDPDDDGSMWREKRRKGK